MDEDVTTIHITKALSSAIIVDLMEKYPNLETITCSPSVYNRTSDTYIDALSQLDIEVVKKYNWGAESKTNGEEFKVLELSNEGLKPKEIAEKLDLKLSRVYYILKKADAKFDNRKRKHNQSLKSKFRRNKKRNTRQTRKKINRKYNKKKKKK